MNGLEQRLIYGFAVFENSRFVTTSSHGTVSFTSPYINPEPTPESFQ